MFKHIGISFGTRIGQKKDRKRSKVIKSYSLKCFPRLVSMPGRRFDLSRFPTFKTKNV